MIWVLLDGLQAVDLGSITVAYEQTLHAGAAAMPSTHVYAVNRSTLNAATAPAGVKVEPAEGITIGLPVDPKPGNSYRLYDPTTQLTGELIYQSTASRGGRSVFTYTTTITVADKD